MPDRLWTMYYLGFTQRDPDYATAYIKCAKLAQAKGYDHLLLWFDHCFSSYSMPANLQIKYRPEKRFRTWPEEEYRTFSLPYFIKGLSKTSTLSPRSSILARNMAGFRGKCIHVVAMHNTASNWFFSPKIKFKPITCIHLPPGHAMPFFLEQQNLR